MERDIRQEKDEIRNRKLKEETKGTRWREELRRLREEKKKYIGVKDKTRWKKKEKTRRKKKNV